jgi:hypothetical protein
MSKPQNSAKPNVSSFGDYFLSLATMSSKLSAGAVGGAHLFGDSLKLLRNELAHARKKDNDETVRNTCLKSWRSTPAGETFEREKVALSKIDPKVRSDVQKKRVKQMRLEENNVALQMERACDAFTGMEILRQTRIVNVVEVTEGSGVFACFVRSEKTLKEMQNVEFTATMLQSVPNHVKYITDKTSTADIAAKVSGGAGRKGKAGKKKGGKTERIAPSALAPALEAIDVSVAAIIKDSGQGIAAGPDANNALHRLWARFDALMTDAEKDAARAAYAALGVKEKAKADKAKGKQAPAAA